jgi:hypothetical protein
MNILSDKFDFLRSADFKLLGQIRRNAIYNCDFLKLVIYNTGGHCTYWPRAPKTPQISILNFILLSSNILNKVIETYLANVSLKYYIIWCGNLDADCANYLKPRSIFGEIRKEICLYKKGDLNYHLWSSNRCRVRIY